MHSGVSAGTSLMTYPAGSQVKITRFDGGRGFRARMMNLGIVPGETVRIIRGGHGMPLVLEVKGTKVMLGRGAAEKIYGSDAL